VNKMNYVDITNEYYTKWLGVEKTVLNKSGVIKVYSEERNKKQIGYSKKYDLFIFCQDTKVIISYGDSVADTIDDLVNEIKTAGNMQDIIEAIEKQYNKVPTHNIKFVYNQIPNIDSHAKQLTYTDYELYRDFFLKCNPCENCDWLKEYYDGMVEKELCFGVFENGIIVSATDLPNMPYMQQKVQEIGINTLPEYRGKNYATIACVTAVEKMISKDIYPQWSTSVHNIASQQLAYKVGFNKFADTLTISL